MILCVVVHTESTCVVQSTCHVGTEEICGTKLLVETRIGRIQLVRRATDERKPPQPTAQSPDRPQPLVIDPVICIDKDRSHFIRALEIRLIDWALK